MSTITQDAMPRVMEERSLTLRSSAGPFLSREQILDATDACFAQAGYDGTTIRAIAAKLDCSVGSIYRYFRDKRDLLLACGRRMMRPVLTEPTFERSLGLYMAIADRGREIYRLQFWLAGEGLPDYIGQIIDHWSELLADRDEAKHRWALLHGLLMLGCDPAQIPEMMGREVGASQRGLREPFWRSESAEDMTLL